MSAKEEKTKRADKKAEPPQRRYRLGSLAGEVPALTKLALGKRGFAEADLVARWASIVGPDIARMALPVKLRLPRAKAAPESGPDGVVPNVAGGTLTLRTSPAASLELQHMKPRILERIASYFGYPVVVDIRLEIGDRRRPAAPRRPLAATALPDLDKIADPDLRAALERLGKARAQRG